MSCAESYRLFLVWSKTFVVLNSWKQLWRNPVQAQVSTKRPVLLTNALSSTPNEKFSLEIITSQTVVVEPFRDDIYMILSWIKRVGRSLPLADLCHLRSAIISFKFNISSEICRFFFIISFRYLIYGISLIQRKNYFHCDHDHDRSSWPNLIFKNKKNNQRVVKQIV